MVRVSPKALVVSLAVFLAAGQSAQAADLHWFYDNQRLQPDRSYDDNDDRSYRNGYTPEPEYSVYQPPRRPAIRQRRHYENGRVSCLQGVKRLLEYGFRHIEVVDCSNGDYLYEAVRGREPWRIQLSGATGEMVHAEPFN